MRGNDERERAAKRAAHPADGFRSAAGMPDERQRAAEAGTGGVAAVPASRPAGRDADEDANLRPDAGPEWRKLFGAVRRAVERLRE